MHKSSTKMWRSSLGAWEIGEKVMAVNEMKVVDKRIPGSLRWWPCIPLYCSTFYRLRQPQYNIYLINNTQKPCFFFFWKSSETMHACKFGNIIYDDEDSKYGCMTLSIMLRMPLLPSELCWLIEAQTCRGISWWIPGNITKSMHGRIYIYSLWLIKNEAYVYFCLYIFVTLFLPIY